MNTYAACNKRKKRPLPVQLTADEIHNFIAHNDDEDNDNESDWDDVGVIDSSVLPNGTLTESSSCRAAPVSFGSRLGSHSEQDNSFTDSRFPSASANCSALVKKDAGVDALFGSMTSNVAEKCITETVPSKTCLFGSDSSDCDDAFGMLDACGDDEDDPNLSLADPGLHIRKSISAIEKKRKESEIELRVQQDLLLMTAIQPVSPSTSQSENSSTSALVVRKVRQEKLARDLSKPKEPAGSSQLHANSPSIAAKSSSLLSTTFDGWVAVPTNLRVFRPLISSELWISRTSSRRVFSLSQFIQRQRSQALLQPPAKRPRSTDVSAADDLVLVGVIGSKVAPRRSRNDRVYSIWCLSDLNEVGPGSPMGCVKLFLFGNCHEKFWKEPEGTVIAVLGPRLMSDSATFDDKDFGITSQSAQHVMLLGQSPDYGICAATIKSGQKCFHVVNKSVCRYCDFHVKKAYYEASSSRPGFFDSSLSVTRNRKPRPNASDLPPPLDTGVYSLLRSNLSSLGLDAPKTIATRVKLSLEKLSAAGYSVDSATGLGTSSSESHRTDNSVRSSEPPINVVPPSISLTSPEKKLVKVLRRPSVGSLNLLRHLQSDSESKDRVLSSSVDSESNCSRGKTPQALIPPAAATEEAVRKKPGITFTEFFASVPKNQPLVSRKSTVPTEGFVDLGPLPITASSTLTTFSGPRLRASALIRSRGGLKVMESQDRLKRLRSAIDQHLLSRTSSKRKFSPLTQVLDTNKPASSKTIPVDPRSSADGAENIPPPPAIKKHQARLERLAALAKQVRQGSTHVGLVDEAENTAELVRLSTLEKRDDMEQKLINQTEERCTFVQCKTCNYRAWKAIPDCRKNGHEVVYLKGAKRYFRCRNCLKRTITFERYPTTACSNCGESLFEKTGIVRERKGPELPGEKLLTRGLEEKFLG